MTADAQWNDQTEDWPKRSWDFWYHSGAPINKLEDLAEVLGMDEPSTVDFLLSNEFGKAAPPELIEEARARAGT